MNTAAKVVLGIGIVMIIIGIIMVATGDSIEENLEEGIIYQATEGSVTIEEIKNNTESMYYVHLVSKTYDGGSQGGYNERHYNNTWNLTEEDCNIVKAFSIKDNDNNEMFYPKCNYVEDGTEDNYIVVGHLCTTLNGEYTDDEGFTYQRWSGDGCPSGTFSFETNGNEVMVYDVGVLLGVGIEWLMKWLGSFGACCCGSLVLIIGIIMAATLEDSNSNPYVQETSYSSSDNENTPKSSGGWDEQEDYIHREKKDEEIPEKSEMAVTEDKEEKKRSREYELPPPPEY